MSPPITVDEELRQIMGVALGEFPGIILDARLHTTETGVVQKLRLHIVDGSFLDIWLSTSGRYSYHWEHRHISGRIYRHDNAPHEKWRKLKTFPRHFHNGSEDNVEESDLPDSPKASVRIFLSWIMSRILVE